MKTGAARILARNKGENEQDYSIENFKGYTFISTPGHGYLVLGSDDNGYSDALAIARRGSFSYVLDGGLVFLEEDCDASEFLNTGISNELDAEPQARLGLKDVQAVKNAEQARQLAIDWQNWAGQESLSYATLADWQRILGQLGARYGLTEEFKENGVI